MNDQPKRARTLKPLAGTVVLLVAALGVNEGMRTKPYYDSVGVLTVCEGITGPDVVAGRTYTLAECYSLRDKFIERMNVRLGACLTEPVSQEEWIAYGHFSYNVGPKWFCQNFAPMINAGDNRGACMRIERYVFADGRDCRIKANNCPGIVKRRAFERDMCLSGVDS